MALLGESMTDYLEDSMKSDAEKSNNGNLEENSKEKISSFGFLSTVKNFFKNFFEKMSIESTGQSVSSKSDDNDKNAKNNSLNLGKTPEIPKTQKTVSKNSEINDHTSNSNDQIFPLPNYFLNLVNKFKVIKSEKNKIIIATGTLIGVLLISYGLFLFSTPIEKVSDNVVFGEKAMFSVFLMLMGILILAATFASRLLDKTFLQKVFKELKIVEEKSVKSKHSVSKKEKNNSLKEDKNV